MPENLRMEQLGQNLEHVGMVGIQKAKGFFDDFKSFVNRGNVVDLAIGMIIGKLIYFYLKLILSNVFFTL